MSTFRERNRRRRAGAATIEVAFVLPIVAIVLIAMFSVAAVIFAQLDVAGWGRYRAWSGRHCPWRPSDHYETVESGLPLPDRFDRIVGDTAHLSPTAVLHAEVETRTLVCSVDPVFARFRVARSEHYTTGGSWDHHEIAFEPPDRHPRLQPTRKFQCFVDRFVSFAPWGALGDFAGSESVSALESARAEHRRVDAREAAEARRSRQRIDESIEAKEAEKSDLEGQLAELLRASPIDEGRVAEVREALREATEQLSRLRAALDRLDQSARVHPDDPYFAPAPTRAR